MSEDKILEIKCFFLPSSENRQPTLEMVSKEKLNEYENSRFRLKLTTANEAKNNYN
jgi:hypothetical protein